MSDIGALVERLVECGLSIGEASSIIAEAVAAGAATAAYRRSPGAVRQQRYRERHKASPCDAPVSNIGVTKRNEVTVSDADFGHRVSITKRNEASQNVTSDNTPLPSSKLDNRKRGERLSRDWLPSDDDRSFAAGLGWSEAQIDAEAANYRDYWIAKPGAGGLKLDWPATWRKWIRSSKVKPAGRSGAVQPLERNWDAAASGWFRFRTWPKGHGNDPDSPACQCPPEILRKYGNKAGAA